MNTQAVVLVCLPGALVIDQAQLTQITVSVSYVVSLSLPFGGIADVDRFCTPVINWFLSTIKLSVMYPSAIRTGSKHGNKRGKQFNACLTPYYSLYHLNTNCCPLSPSFLFETK